MPSKKKTILGQDTDILLALWANVLSWLFQMIAPSYAYILLPQEGLEPVEREIDAENIHRSSKGNTRCVSIGRPGGLEQLRVITLRDNVSTVGYNVRYFCPPPFTPALALAADASKSMHSSSNTQTIPDDCIILQNEYFSVNYADCTIRWGLYESAKEFVGFPIVPGFDVAGTVEQVGGHPFNDDSITKNDATRFLPGERVFGCTLFGAYSTRVLVPKVQLRRIPDGITTSQASSLPAVSLTALYALSLAGAWPAPGNRYSNRAVLIHSAAGGVGSMLVQMSKLLNLGPVVGVVGSASKIDAARSMGCDVVINRGLDNGKNLWQAAVEAVPQGYAAIFDANGVSTLQQSYDHLAPTGRLIVFGFHSNLPRGKAMLSPAEWVRMALKQSAMPKFDAMDMTVSNKSVLGFNLSFFSNEVDLVSDLFDQIVQWLQEKKLQCSNIVEMEMESIADAHELIQSGKSFGKIVVRAK